MGGLYPQSALGLAEDLSPYPRKLLLADQGIVAYRMEFSTFEADAARVVGAIAAEFPLLSLAHFQEGKARNECTSAHFTWRPIRRMQTGWNSWTSTRREDDRLITLEWMSDRKSALDQYGSGLANTFDIRRL